MKTLESLNAKKFQMLTVQEAADIQGGRFFPKRGTDSLGWCMMGGNTVEYSADWRTGWGRDDKVYGDAYISGND